MMATTPFLIGALIGACFSIVIQAFLVFRAIQLKWSGWHYFVVYQAIALWFFCVYVWIQWLCLEVLR